MQLERLGWPREWSLEEDKASKVARITSMLRGQYKGISSSGEIILTLSGKYKQKKNHNLVHPAVGDWVEFGDTFTDSKGRLSATIDQTFTRYSKISRVRAGTTSEEQVLAANVEYAFIVSSTNQDLKIPRLNRYLLMVRNGNVQPVLILSKIDLSPSYRDIEATLKNEFPQVPVHCISTLEMSGLHELLRYFQAGQTCVFLGSSGVGKSTLLNHFIGDGTQRVQDIREGDDKGKHTTTSRELFFLEEGGMLIDTPGLREIQVFGDDSHLTTGFQEVESLIRSCRYSNCTHEQEDGCAIREALETGTLKAENWSQFLKLQKELAFANRKMDKREQSNAKKRWRDINVGMRQRRKFEKK